MIQLNWQAILTQAIAFIALIFLLKKFFFQRVLDYLDERRLAVQATIEQMAADRAAMERARTDYEQRLRNIEEEARGRIQAAIKEAQQLREQIVTDAHNQGEALLQRAREEIDRDKRKALVELRTEVANLAVGAATKILGRSIDPQAQRDLLQGFIDDVGRA